MGPGGTGVLGVSAPGAGSPTRGMGKKREIRARPATCAAPDDGARSMRSGMGLLEVMLTLVVLSVALLGFLQVLFASNRASEITRDAATVKDVARQTIETLRAANFSQVFALY